MKSFGIKNFGVYIVAFCLAKVTLYSQDYSKYNKFKAQIFSAEHHMLHEGDSLSFSVNASTILRMANTRVSGASISELTVYNTPFNLKGDFTLPDQGAQMVRDLRLPMTRLYKINNQAGGREFDLFGAIDRVHVIAEKFGIPEENIVMELNNARKSLTTPEEWKDAVAYAICKGYKFRYWEPANEPHYNKGLYPSAEFFAQYVKEISTAVKTVDPEAQIVMDILHTDISPEWHYYLLDLAKGYYDCVAPHNYNAGRELVYDPLDEPYEDFVLAENWLEMDIYYRIQKAIDEFNPGGYLYETEWAMNRKPSSPGPNETADWQLINSGPLGTMHRIVRMIYLAQAGFEIGASCWTLFAYIPDRLGFGIVPRYDYTKTTMLYWAYYYINRHLGALLPEIEGESPYYTGKTYKELYPYSIKDLSNYSGPATPVLITMNEEKSELYMILVNGLSDSPVPCSFKIDHATVSNPEAVILSHSKPDAHPELLDKSEWVSPFEMAISNGSTAFDLPERSAVFIKMDLVVEMNE